jgi:hypothetical protein
MSVQLEEDMHVLRIHRFAPSLVAVVAFVSALVGGPGIASAQHPEWLVLPGPGNGYVNVPNHADLNPADEITLELWVYLVTGNTADGHGTVSLVGKNLNAGYWFGVDQRRFRFHYQGLTSFRDGSGLIPIGEWIHVAVTFAQGELSFYLNGVLDSTHDDVSGQLAQSNAPLQIGADSYFGRTPFGAIDEVRIWNVARSEAEIAANMNAPITDPTEGLVASWNFDGDFSDPIGEHDGELHGAAELGSSLPERDSCPNETFVPAGAHIRGKFGSQWRTDLTIYNSTKDDVDAEIFLLPRDDNNLEAESITVTVPEGTSVVLPDIVLDRFGENSLAAAFRICSDLPLRISTRTYNLSDQGTFGQGIPGVPAALGVRQGTLIALYENAQYRTNIGFVNTRPNFTTVLIDFYDASGSLIGSALFDLEPYGHIQINQAFREVTQSAIASGRVEFYAESAEVIGYASVGDANTSDGTYLSTD